MTSPLRPSFDTVAEEGAANGFLDDFPKVPPPPPPRMTPVRTSSLGGDANHNTGKHEDYEDIAALRAQ